MRFQLSSYDNATVGSGSIVNEVQLAYNDFGQFIAADQSHSGAVNKSTSSKLECGDPVTRLCCESSRSTESLLFCFEKTSPCVLEPADVASLECPPIVELRRAVRPELRNGFGR